MDDQFGGRTDDDLFNDDFEPVENEAILVEEVQYPQSAPEPTPAAPAPAPVQSSRPRQPKPKKSSPPANKAPSTASASQPRPQQQQQAKGGNLSSSRFARKGNVSQKQQSTPTPPAASKSPLPTNTVTRERPKGNQPGHTEEVDSSPPPNAPTAPAKDNKSHGSHSAAATPEARLGSGANPRQKLTEAELAAKMEQMKLLSAEKARKFEMAEQDEKQHAQAYAKGMEEARKRRAEDAQRRRRGEEDKRRLDDERAKNRERKLKAMGMKEGGWDEGKEAILEEEARKGFRGANGGVRGAKRGGGLGGSRFARDGEGGGQELPDVDRFLDERHRRDRGRGRGGRGDSRGGGGQAAVGGGPSSKSKPISGGGGPPPALTTDDFPALPSDTNKKNADAATAPVYPPPKTEVLPIPPLEAPTGASPGGKWDEEMQALDELKQEKGQS
ncbi:hypothetical protein E4U41_007549 [Claviceps citrina]|nr:hypothetical protein E4U41_007549 [Claviceps citrina]